MTTKQLQNILDYALQQAHDGCVVLDDMTDKGFDSTEYYEQQLRDLNAINEMLSEVKTLYKVRGEDDNWSHEICFITMANVCESVNNGLYDFYGELYRANGNQRVECKNFIAALRSNIYEFGFEQYTDYMLESGWQVISDLYEDNEKDAANDPLTGHFNR